MLRLSQGIPDESTYECPGKVYGRSALYASSFPSGRLSLGGRFEEGRNADHTRPNATAARTTDTAFSEYSSGNFMRSTVGRPKFPTPDLYGRSTQLPA
ncbi:hypothetical protein ZHAS_00009685 [Anopheles sinensis]|uniref:Uncharacterized protein n=1 Tax=Anopheles sinensis TaxID=74873 RepID=A0A084VV50_ANOSI|nr:hypothetical protein ZHAS_00009685 [Anopheles sinensis]